MRESKVCFNCQKKISPLSTYVSLKKTTYGYLVDMFGDKAVFCSTSCFMQTFGGEIIDPKLEMAPYGECDLWKH